MKLDVVLKDLKDRRFFKSPLNRWALIVSVGGAIATLSFGLYQVSQLAASQSQPTPTPVSTPAIASVTALGRLEPEDEVITLSPPSSVDGARVTQLLVAQGDWVKAGQVVAILDSRDRLQATLEQSRRQVQVAQANLAKVAAGAKSGEIAAQEAEIARLQAQLNGEVDTQRATLARLQAQLGNETPAQQARVARLQTQLNGERKTQQARITRLQAQLNGERKTQQARIARLQAQLNGERKTQQARIARLQAAVNNAQTEFERYQRLFQQGAVEASRFDSKRLELETAARQLNEAQEILNQAEQTLQQQILEAQATRDQSLETLQQQINEAQAARSQSLEGLQQQIIETQATRNQSLETLQEQLNEAQANRNRTINTLTQQINQAKATLNKIAEIRPTDVQASQAEIESAIASAKRAEADLELAYVKAPVDSQVLKINTRPGEVAGNNGIIQLGKTDRMVVIAEVYESDINKVRLNQSATITSESNTFEQEIEGTVSQIDLQIGKKDILGTDPTADVDARVIEVKILLKPEDSRLVAGLTNSKVIVKINLNSSSS